jgi:hypothetical protein
LPDSAPSRTSRAVLLVTAALIAASVGLSLLANASDKQLHALGSLIRRGGDVTPERVFRLRVVGYSLGMAFAVAALLVWRNQRRVAGFVEEACEEIRRFPSEVARWWTSLTISNRASFLLILAIGAALRIFYLNAPMAYDEAYSFTNFARRPLLEALADYNNTNNHLLNTFFMHVMYRVSGQHEWALRLPVLIAGMLLVAVTFPWARARIGAAPALLATSFVAASPMMVDFSVNARGYTFIALFAVLLDGCFMRIAQPMPGTPRAATWIAAAVCIWLGLFAMPTFLHPLAGIVLWFVVEARFARQSFWPRAVSIVTCLVFAGLMVAATYLPAFVFRGTMAFQNEFVQPLPIQQWTNDFAWSVWKGVQRWIDGGTPGVLLIVFAWSGVVAWFRRSFDDRRAAGWGGFALLSIFAVPMALMALHRLAPPPRLYFWLAPWFYLLVATGAGYAVGLLQRFGLRTSGDTIMRFLAYAVAAVGILFAFEHSILREPHQREFGIGSVPAALRKLATIVPPGEAARLYAPLPCDHPAIYYAAKYRSTVAINGAPQPGERLFLITRLGDDPISTLRDLVVKQESNAKTIGSWNEVEKFAELTLWEASRRFAPPNTMKPMKPGASP